MSRVHGSRRERVWPLRLALTEGVTNARSGRWASVTVLLAAAWTVAVAGLADAVEVDRLLRAEQEWIVAGGRTLVIESGDRTSVGSVDAASCERLGDDVGIAGAFAVRSTGLAAEPRTAPGSRTTITHVSPGVFAFLGLDEPERAGVLAAPQVVDELGVRDGDSIVLDVVAVDPGVARTTGSVEVRVVAAPVLSDEIAGTWLVPDLSRGPATSCYVSAEAGTLADVRDYAAVALASPDGVPAVVRPRLARTLHGLDFGSAFSARSSRWSSLAGAALLTAMWAVTGWGRRSRTAVYATFGAHRAAMITIHAGEWAALAGTGAVWGWALAFSGGLALGTEVGTTLACVTAHALVVVCTATLGVLVLALLPPGNILDALKDGR